MRVLVTGGAGYIGSHAVVELIAQGHEPLVVDNLVNSSAESLARVAQITGIPVEFHEQDARDTEALTHLLRNKPCDAVIHFAGHKAVGESVENPVAYYRNNIDSTLSVIEATLETADIARPPRVIFSSSATVYGIPQFLPLTEDHPVGAGISNPYGQTKYMCEQILSDVSHANPSFQAIVLRYFNPVGAHPIGLIGEDPRGEPNNLAPYITQVVAGTRERLRIFGDDYATVDGTGVRDYVHVMDLAAGHVAALNYTTSGFHAFNLGTGAGTSVKELLTAFEAAVGKPIPYEVFPRRAGDIATSIASPQRAATVLGWSATHSVEQACTDAWHWQSANPQGYASNGLDVTPAE